MPPAREQESSHKLLTVSQSGRTWFTGHTFAVLDTISENPKQRETPNWNHTEAGRRGWW